MSGEELKQKLKDAGYTQAEVARRLGVVSQSVIQTLEAKDIKTGFIEELCRVLDKDMSFFYGDMIQRNNDALQEELEELREENRKLKAELSRVKDPNMKNKSDRIYNLWMKFMEVTAEMQELYKEDKER